MSFLCDNIAVLVVAGVASLIAWMFGGARGDLLTPVAPWLLVLMVEVIVCFPQRRHGESSFEARERVWYELRHGAVFWLSAALLVLLLIPFVNNGICVDCDAGLIAQGISPEPPFSFLPFCVNRLEHLNVVWWFALSLSAVVAVRYCLNRRGKRRVLELIVWNGVGLAILGFVQNVFNAPGPLWQGEFGLGTKDSFFATFGYPNMAGDYFTSLFGLSVALWRDRCERVRRELQELDSSEKDSHQGRRGHFWSCHYFLMPACLFFFAALNTLSRAAIILVTTMACICFFHTLAMTLVRQRRSRRVVIGVWSIVVFGLIVFFACVAMPTRFQQEVNTVETTTVLDRVTGKNQYHFQVAKEIWQDHLFFGCGGWGYRHFCVPKMKKLLIDLKELQRVGGANVHNDHLQFLVEHGMVGFGLIWAIILALLGPIVRQWQMMLRTLRFKKTKRTYAKPVTIFVLPPAVFFILLTVLSTTVHGFGDCPLRSSAVLMLYFISLAALPGFMPKVERLV